MERDDKESKQMLDQALSAGDEWLRKQGVITDFSINTIITWVYVNFEKVENVEMDVDRPNQRLYVRLYLSFWTLFLMTIFRQKDAFLDVVFNWLTEYLPTYELSVELKRWRGGKREKFTVNSGDDASDDADKLPQNEGNIADALRERKNRVQNPKDTPTPSAPIEDLPESTTSTSNPNGDEESKS